MTESEAKGRWCPMVRANDWGSISVSLEDKDGAYDTEAIASAMPVNRQAFSDTPNGFQDSEGTTNPLYCCIGSACMMWRHSRSSDLPTLGEVIGGHCGLAGKP